MKWYQLTEAQRKNFIRYLLNNYTPENGYTQEELIDALENVHKGLYFIEEQTGLTFQY